MNCWIIWGKLLKPLKLWSVAGKNALQWTVTVQVRFSILSLKKKKMPKMELLMLSPLSQNQDLITVLAFPEMKSETNQESPGQY